MSLARIIAPFSLGDFYDRYWEQDSVHIKRSHGDHFSDILDLEEIDRIFSSVRLSRPSIDLALGDEPLSKESFFDGDVLNRDKVLGLHSDGATIILRSFHGWSSRLQRLRVTIEKETGCPCQANVYLTPQGGKSTPPHFDTHDIFVLQIHGTKNWRLFEGGLPLPRSRNGFDATTHHVGPVIADVTLQAGDTFYLPRGRIHEPVAIAYSIHVSIGIISTTWSDVMHEMIDTLSESDVRFRRSIALPCLARAGTNDADMTVALGQRVDAIRDLELLRSANLRLKDRFVETREPIVHGQLGAIAGRIKLTPETPVRLREGLIFATRMADERFQLEYRGVVLSFPALLGPVVDAALLGTAARIRDWPGCISEAEKCQVAERLLVEGVIVLA